MHIKTSWFIDIFMNTISLFCSNFETMNKGGTTPIRSTNYAVVDIG